MFGGCTLLKNIILPISLKEVGNHAFSECTALEEVIIPYGTEKVDAAFERYTSLKGVYVPDTVAYFSSGVLDGSPDAIIYCTADSAAAKVCRENNISYLTDSFVNIPINVLYNGKRISFYKYGKNLK